MAAPQSQPQPQPQGAEHTHSRALRARSAEGAEGAEGAALAEARLALDRAWADAAGARADATALRAALRAALRRLREAPDARPPAPAPAQAPAPALSAALGLLGLPPHLLCHALAPQRLGCRLGCRAFCRTLHAAVQAHFLPVAPPPGPLGTCLEPELHGAAMVRLYCEYCRWSRAPARRRGGSSALDAFFALAPWARAGAVPAAWSAEPWLLALQRAEAPSARDVRGHRRRHGPGHDAELWRRPASSRYYQPRADDPTAPARPPWRPGPRPACTSVRLLTLALVLRPGGLPGGPGLPEPSRAMRRALCKAARVLRALLPVPVAVGARRRCMRLPRSLTRSAPGARQLDACAVDHARVLTAVRPADGPVAWGAATCTVCLMAPHLFLAGQASLQRSAECHASVVSTFFVERAPAAQAGRRLVLLVVAAALDECKLGRCANRGCLRSRDVHDLRLCPTCWRELQLAGLAHDVPAAGAALDRVTRDQGLCAGSP